MIWSNEMKRLTVAEIFGPTIQGEGPVIGRPSLFVRFAGCDLRCVWCDSRQAVDPASKSAWRSLSASEILAELERRSGQRPMLVTLSGGNPALQDLGGLIRRGKAMGYSFALETQGSKARKWFRKLDVLILSPKGPSAGVKQDESQLRRCLDDSPRKLYKCLKIVIFSDEDYAFARRLAQDFPRIPLYLQVGNPTTSGPVDEERLKTRFRELAERLEKDGWFEATLLPQLHLWAWGNALCR